MTPDAREPEAEDRLRSLEARLGAANRAKGRRPNPSPSGRRRRVNYRRRLEEARKSLNEEDRGTGLLLLESLDNDYPSVDSILGEEIGGGDYGGGDPGWGEAGGDAGGGGS